MPEMSELMVMRLQDAGRSPASIPRAASVYSHVVANGVAHYIALTLIALLSRSRQYSGLR